MTISPVSRRVSRRSVLQTGLIGSIGYALVSTSSTRETSDQVERLLRTMSLEDKIGQLFVLFAYGADADEADTRNTALYGAATATAIVRKYRPGGWVYFDARGNVQDLAQVGRLSTRLQEAASVTGAEVPLMIAIDQEHGIVSRLGLPFPQFPGNMALGATRDTDAARTAASITGSGLRAIGVRQNYAPVADVNVNPRNLVIGVRAFSSDPTLTAAMTVAQVRGFQGEAHVAATVKHFPGHGDTVVDSHTALPTIPHTREEWNTTDAPPFRAAIAAGVDSIMTAHIAVPALDPSGDPATLSKPILTGVLRQQLGFGGVIVTDGLEMAAVRERYGDDEVVIRAIEAGADQLLLPPAPASQFDALVGAVRAGRLPERRVDESVRRILRMKYKRDVAPRTIGQDPIAVAQGTADRSVTVVRNDVGRLPFPERPGSVLVVGWGEKTLGLLADRLGTRGAHPTVLHTGSSPSRDDIARASDTARAAEVAVVLTARAWDTTATDPNGGQRRLVAELLHTGVPVVVVAVRDPYDVAGFGDAPTVVATYGYTSVSMEALARILYGEVDPVGKLPVDVPALDGARVLYPFGHGIAWQ